VLGFDTRGSRLQRLPSRRFVTWEKDDRSKGHPIREADR
jgi:hypothetical protein